MINIFLIKNSLYRVSSKVWLVSYKCLSKKSKFKHYYTIFIRTTQESNQGSKEAIFTEKNQTKILWWMFTFNISPFWNVIKRLDVLDKCKYCIIVFNCSYVYHHTPNNVWQPKPSSSLWVRGVMVLDVGCEFRNRGSIPSECQIPRDVDLGQVNFTIALVASS